jgi:hypothetical protein
MNPPPTLPTTHRYEVRRSDLFTAYLISVFFSKITMGMLIVLMGVAAFACSTGEMPKEYPGIVRVVAAMFGILSVLVFWGVLHLVIVTIMVFGRANKGLLGFHTLVLTEAGLVEKTDYNETLHRWNGFHKVRDSFGYLFLFVTETMYHQVPKKSFGSREEAQRFAAEIRQRSGCA